MFTAFIDSTTPLTLDSGDTVRIAGGSAFVVAQQQLDLALGIYPDTIRMVLAPGREVLFTERDALRTPRGEMVGYLYWAQDTFATLYVLD